MRDDLAWQFNGSDENEAILKPLCLEIEKHFELPRKRLCRYFATWEDPCMTQMHGIHYRGFHVPRSARVCLPMYLINCFYLPSDESYGLPFDETIAFDNLIYIRENTCRDVTGFVSTYAHELQHFVQHGFTPKLSKVNSILYYNLKTVKADATAIDVPHEREANIVSKRITERICGSGALEKFVAEQLKIMEQCGDGEQKTRWLFYRDVPSSTPYDLAEETVKLVDKYRDSIDFETDTIKPEWWKE